jgi:hypothetical protein
MFWSEQGSWHPFKFWSCRCQTIWASGHKNTMYRKQGVAGSLDSNLSPPAGRELNVRPLSPLTIRSGRSREKFMYEDVSQVAGKIEQWWLLQRGCGVAPCHETIRASSASSTRLEIRTRGRALNRKNWWILTVTRASGYWSIIPTMKTMVNYLTAHGTKSQRQLLSLHIYAIQ